MKRKDLMKSFAEPKFIQLQKSAHQEILSVGKDVEKKSDQQQQEAFEIRVNEKIMIVKTECEADKELAIRELRVKFEKDVENVRKDALELQNKALKREAKRVEEIMDKRASALVKDAVLEGQRNLDTALVRAREKFDKEKEVAVQNAIADQQHIAALNREELDMQHQRDMENNNREWQDKLEKELESLTELMNKKNEAEKKQLQMENEEQMNRLVAKNSKERLQELQKVTNTFNQEQKTNLELRATIQKMEDHNLELNERIKTLVKTFQGFIESVPGFSDGQADFMLKDVIPDIEEICNAK